METEEAVARNEKAQKQMLADLYADIKELLEVDADQVQWDLVQEAASLASSLSELINPHVEIVAE